MSSIPMSWQLLYELLEIVADIGTSDDDQTGCAEGQLKCAKKLIPLIPEIRWSDIYDAYECFDFYGDWVELILLVIDSGKLKSPLNAKNFFKILEMEKSTDLSAKFYTLELLATYLPGDIQFTVDDAIACIETFESPISQIKALPILQKHIAEIDEFDRRARVAIEERFRELSDYLLKSELDKAMRNAAIEDLPACRDQWISDAAVRSRFDKLISADG